MLETIKRLALGVILIALAAGVLLYTDRGSRNRGSDHPGACGAGERDLNRLKSSVFEKLSTAA